MQEVSTQYDDIMYEYIKQATEQIKDKIIYNNENYAYDPYQGDPDESDS